MDYAGRATVMPRNKPALFRTRCVRGPGWIRCPYRSDTGTENQDSVNEALEIYSIQNIGIYWWSA